MKIGILVEVEEGLDWDTWRATFRAAEQLGFESVWLSDHLQSPWGTRHGLETWTALAVAAAETSRLVLGPLVSPVTFREPAIVARMAATLYDLSWGRLVVGLGLGWNADEHAAAEIPFPSAIERSHRLSMTVERIRCEATDVPILIGGSGSRVTLPLVARHADQWNITTNSPETFAAANQQLDDLCVSDGREPGAILRSVACGVLVARDMSELEARAERMRQYVPPLLSVEHARGMGWLVGTVEEVIAQLRRLAAVGVERVVLGHYDVRDTTILELLAKTVIVEFG